MSEEGLKRALATLKGVDLTAMGAEVKNLLAIKAWAVASLHLGYEVGDRVGIISPEPAAKALSSTGWRSYREALRMGQSGVVREISFNGTGGGWQTLVAMDRSWGVIENFKGEITGRYWNGPEGECPEGFTWDKEKVKCFSFDARWVGPV